MLMYIRTARASCTVAMVSEPNATDPRWKKNKRRSDDRMGVLIDKQPMADLFWQKYHVETAPETTMM